MKFSTLFMTAGIFAILALPGCEKPTAVEQAESPKTPEPAPVAQEMKKEIDWFEGGVDEAFALARTENRPVFLYWGAVWCPPCVEIKQTVFKSPKFIAQTELFIPVYLDGDTERAQVYGEKFDTKVYPTMIVFNPAGEEVTRLNAGMDISAYDTVLEVSLDSMRPTSALVEAALADPQSLSAAEIQQLAYYSWYDGDKALAADGSTELFLSLSETAADSNPAASARFYLQYLVTLAGDEENSVKADPAGLKAVLASPELVFACWDYLTSYAKPIVSVLEADETGSAALAESLSDTVLANRHDPRLSTAKQVSGWNPYLAFHPQGGEDSQSLPDEVIAAIRADGQAADEKTSGTHSRQNVINAVYGVYLRAGLADDARTLLAAEIETSKTPYYFMSALAYLEEQEGNFPRALELRKQAYEASEGPATRIRWWSRYVQAAVRMAPEDPERVLDAATAVFEDPMDDAFTGFNFRNLQKASDSLEEWDTERQPEQSALTGFHERIRAACEQQQPESPEQGNCLSLLGP